MDLFLSQFKHASSLTLIHIVIKNFVTRLNPHKWLSICRDQRVLACVAYTLAISCVAMGSWSLVQRTRRLNMVWKRFGLVPATPHPLRATHFYYPLPPPPPRNWSGLLTSPSRVLIMPPARWGRWHWRANNIYSDMPWRHSLFVGRDTECLALVSPVIAPGYCFCVSLFCPCFWSVFVVPLYLRDSKSVEIVAIRWRGDFMCRVQCFRHAVRCLLTLCTKPTPSSSQQQPYQISRDGFRHTIIYD